MGTGRPPVASIRRFRSATEASPTTRKGYPSGKPTRSPCRARAGFSGRLKAGPILASLQGVPSTAPSHEAAASPQSSARRPSLDQTRTRKTGASGSGGLRTRISPKLLARSVSADPSRKAPTSAIRGTSRWVRKLPAGSATRKRRSPTGPRESTSADWTASPRSDLTGWMFSAARCMRARASAPLADLANLGLDPLRRLQFLRALRPELFEPPGARQQLLLERADGRVEVPHGGREAL